MSLSNAEARQLVLQNSDVELWEIEYGLDRAGPAFPGDVRAALVADMLIVGEPENWPRTARPTLPETAMFAPYVQRPQDGQWLRSWLPDDLAAEDEEGIRALSIATENPFVKARLREVLWARFRKFPDASRAIDARLASAPLCKADRDWPRVVRNLGRLTMLVLSVNAKAQLPELLAALDAAEADLLGCKMPYSFPVLADMVLNTLLAKQQTRLAFSTERAERWDGGLDKLAKSYEEDPHHGVDALLVLQAWRMRSGNEAGRDDARRRAVECLRKASASGQPGVAPSHLQHALKLALDFGIPELVEAVRAELMPAIRRSITEFKQVSVPLEVPPGILAQLDRILTISPDLSLSVRLLSVMPGLLEVDVEAIRERARESMKDRGFLAMVPATRYHLDGRVVFSSGNPEDILTHHASIYFGAHLSMIEAALGYFLQQAVERLDARTLIDAVASWPHLVEPRAQLLSVASERFAERDWISSGVIVSTVYEAVLRDLVRAGGYSAARTEPGGVQMDETLNTLLRSPFVRDLLSSRYCDLVEHVLCDPALGWNLRNEVAHGTVRPGQLSPPRVFMIWLLLIRLTAFVAKPRATASAPPAGTPTESDIDGAVQA